MKETVQDALDVIVEVAALWDERVLGNELISSDAALLQAATQVSDLLGHFYQVAGQKLLPS